MKNKEKTFEIIALVVVSCIAMAIVETIIEPTYVIKSIMKGIFFLLLPVLFLKLKKERVFREFFAINKKSAIKLLVLGIGIYIVIMCAYFLTENIFDYSSLVNSLSADQKVNGNSFIWVALYISFCNSFFEEFLFRFFAFILLSEHTKRAAAYIFSSVMFAIYHIAMIMTSFPLPLLVLSLAGLVVGGLIFNYVNRKNKNIYNSWIVHMFADFAIMTVWYIYI